MTIEKKLKVNTRVYVQTPRWFLRPRNTDWRYTRFTLPRIQEFAPDCEFHVSRSYSTVFHVNARYTFYTLLRSLKMSAEWHYLPAIDRKEFIASESQLVFSHDDFPVNADSIPVIWQNSILDPAMVMARGASKEHLEIQFEIKKLGFQKASAVQVSTEAERERLSGWFPEIKEKFVAIPFFLPEAKTISLDCMETKIKRRGPLRCLFVGHEARRKGLDRVYAAMERLPSDAKKKIHLTVISRQTDGVVTSPSLPNLTVVDAIAHDQVLQSMRESDVLLMPSYFESYGLVYLEAMAQGTIPIVPDWEVQREIVDYGKAGIITTGDAVDLAASLESLCDDEDLRIRLATNARQRFEDHFAPSVVASKYRDLFRKVVTLSRDGHWLGQNQK